MILIVGANSFFGNQLQKLFLKKIKFFASDISLKENNYLDIRNKNSIKDIIKKNNINIIINCSCEPATSKSKKKLWSTNVEGNKNLIESCLEFNIKKYIYISTSAIWVKNYENPVDESEEYNPVEIMENQKYRQKKIL